MVDMGFLCLLVFVCYRINLPPLRHLILKAHLSYVTCVYFRCEGDVMKGTAIIPPTPPIVGGWCD